MQIAWGRLGFATVVSTVIVVGIIAAQPTGAKPSDPYTHPCGKCGPNDVCGVGNWGPIRCGPSKNGPWTGSTYPCCCCVPGGNKNWIQGE